MAGRRYRDDKKPYKANSYIAQLNHNRAMQAGEPSPQETVKISNDDYFMSSRRPEKFGQDKNIGMHGGISSYRDDVYDVSGVTEDGNYSGRNIKSENLADEYAPKVKSQQSFILRENNGGNRYSCPKNRYSDNPRSQHSRAYENYPINTESGAYGAEMPYGDEKINHIFKDKNSGFESNGKTRNGVNENNCKQPGGKGKAAVITVSSLLITAMIIFTVLQIIHSKMSGETVLQTEAQSAVVQQTTAVIPTEPPKTTVSALDFETPNPKDDNSDGYLDNGIFIWNDCGYELFYGTDESAKNYADAVNRYAKDLGSDIKTYVMVVPTHAEMSLPKRFSESGQITNVPQKDNIKTVYENLDKEITPINCYNELVRHSEEYIYFNTDHHWTGLGAYYGYKAYAEAEGLPVLDLADCQKNSIEGFLGSIAQDVQAELSPDRVDYWEFPYNTSNDIYYEPDGEPTRLNVYYEGAAPGSLTYGVFIWGDQPLEVLHSDKNDKGEKIAVVKESYGNALVPYLTNNYQEVHVIDFRYWQGKLKDYCRQNGIKKVLFINGIMSANTEIQIQSMDTLFDAHPD